MHSTTALLNNRYSIKSTLGEGTFAEVYLAEDTKIGPSRTLPQFALDALQILDKFSPYFEFVERRIDDPDHKAAISTL